MKFKKWTKLTAVIMVAALSAATCCSCEKKVNDKDEQGRTIVSVGNWPTKEGVNLDKVNARKERFEKANLDIVIEPDNWSFDRKTFYAKAAGGQLPTVYNAGYTEIPEIKNSEYSADLTSVLSKRGYDGMFNQDVVDVLSKDGKMLAFPSSAYILGLAYNVDMFEAAGLMNEDGTPMQPKDWYEVAEFAVKIKEATGKAGIVFPTINKSGGWIFTPVAWSFGVDFMEQDKDGKWKATFNSPEMVEALQYIKDLKWKYDVLPANTLIDGTEDKKLLATHNAAMLIYAGDIPDYVYQYGMTPEQLGMMAMPAGPKRHVTLLGGGVYCVSPESTEAQIDGAIRWIETAYNYNATDEYKTNLQQSIDKALADNRLVGINSMSVWSSKADSVAYANQLTAEKANININHVRLYNEFIENCPADIQAEEPVCAQELYDILDGCLQEVLNNKDADCAKLIEKAASDFQANYLDNLTY